MNTNNYNGWTNRETWLVNLHFDINSKEDLYFIKEQLEEDAQNIESIFLRDFIDLSKINWQELEENL